MAYFLQKSRAKARFQATRPLNCCYYDVFRRDGPASSLAPDAWQRYQIAGGVAPQLSAELFQSVKKAQSPY